MKKIILLFSMMLLMTATMFGQQDWLRKSRIYLVEGTPTFTPNKYRGSVMALDTADSYKLYMYDYAASSWSSKLNIEDITTQGGVSTLDTIRSLEATVDSVSVGTLNVREALEVPWTSVAGVDDTLSTTGVAFVATYTATGAQEINLGADATWEGRMIMIRDDGNATTNNLTLTGIESVTINGGASYVMNADDESVILVATSATNWDIFGAYLE